MDTKTIKAADLRAGDVVVEEDGFTLIRLVVLGEGVETQGEVVRAKVRDEDGDEGDAEWDAKQPLEVEREVPTTDLGAGGTVQAESFAVEVQLVNGVTSVLDKRYETCDDAEAAVERIEAGIRRGEFEIWRQAYVVTADGTEV